MSDIITAIPSALDAAGRLAIDIRTAITGKIPEAEAKLRELELAIKSAALDMERSVLQGQIEINKIEAASPDRYRGWWRPSVGWLCVLALAMDWIIAPILRVWWPIPYLASDQMTTILLAMLGLGGMRTIERVTKSEPAPILAPKTVSRPEPRGPRRRGREEPDR